MRSFVFVRCVGSAAAAVFFCLYLAYLTAERNHREMMMKLDCVLQRLCARQVEATSDDLTGRDNNNDDAYVSITSSGNKCQSFQWFPGSELPKLLVPQKAPLVPDYGYSSSLKNRVGGLVPISNSSQEFIELERGTGAFVIDPKDPHKYPLIMTLCVVIEELLAEKDIADFGTGYGYLGRCMLRSKRHYLPPWGTRMEDDDYFRCFRLLKMRWPITQFSDLCSYFTLSTSTYSQKFYSHPGLYYLH